MRECSRLMLTLAATPLQLRQLATLRLSAASALVCQGHSFWVLADDALVLQRYSLSGDWQAELTLLPCELPSDAKLRKRLKPDFEALMSLPADSLLALGSGSTECRCRGCLVEAGNVRVIDLNPLYRALAEHFPGTIDFYANGKYVYKAGDLPAGEQTLKLEYTVLDNDRTSSTACFELNLKGIQNSAQQVGD